MTEDEAKKKWCPMVRVVYGVGDNRGEFPSTTSCIGSACIMWREYPRELIGYEDSGKPIIIDGAEGGYCGLSGRGC